MVLTHGGRYSATITLSGLESYASNAMVAQKLSDGGFSGVTVTGSGSSRHAEGTWDGPTSEGAVPSQVTGLTMLSAPQAPPVPVPAPPATSKTPSSIARGALPSSAVVATITPVTPAGEIPKPVLAIAFVAAGAALGSAMAWLFAKALAGEHRAR